MPPVSSTDEPPAETKPSAAILKERRFKLSRACDRCRRRRIKCDEGHPCQSCLTSNSACTFEEPGKRTHPHKSKRAATLEDRMHHLETLIQAIPPAVFAAGGLANAAPSPIEGTMGAFTSSSNVFTSGVPPPSLNTYPLTNPSNYFQPAQNASRQTSPISVSSQTCFAGNGAPEQTAEDAAHMSLSPSYLYFDDEGHTRWQGETSGLPLLDLLVERHAVLNKPDPDRSSWSTSGAHVVMNDWFPDRSPKQTDTNPEGVWKLISSFIPPELMDSLVQCYLSTSYYILPFLHIPTFLADYGNPRKWGEPGFAAFIVAVCCLASRHIDDPRVRSDPNDGNTAGITWFELFGRLRSLPTADQPTVYTVQSVLIAGVYAIGLGKLSRAFALLSEAITLSIDAGLHRTADAYDLFDPVEDEVRKRTFWCVYMWDKQACSHFGRPPMIRLRDCDVGEPAIIDDEFISHEGVGVQPPDTESRMSAFVCSVRYFVILESLLDVPPSRNFGDGSAFLTRATAILAGSRRHKERREEEAMLDDIHRSIPAYWAHTPETAASDDVIRVTQSERLHCAEQFIRMLIHRHRFSEMIAERAYNHDHAGHQEQREAEVEAMRAAHSCALQIISSHLQTAAKGLMTYFGVHVIHQLTAAGRTLVAVLLNCHSEPLRPLITPALEALRSCVGLLKRFSGRYVCGLRSGDLMEEFCRLTQIPLESSRGQDGNNPKSRLPWIRPVRKKTPSIARSSAGESPNPSSPESFSPSDAFVDLNGSGGSPQPPFTTPSASLLSQQNSFNMRASPTDRASSFADSNGMDVLSGDEMSLTSAELFALFNDGTVDVSSLLMSPSDMSTASATTPLANGFYSELGAGLPGNGNGHIAGMVSP